MDKKELIEMIKSDKTKTTEEVLSEVIPQIKSDNFTKEEQPLYSNFRVYKKRFEDNKTNGLKFQALKKLFNYFGYKPVIFWIKKD